MVTIITNIQDIANEMTQILVKHVKIQFIFVINVVLKQVYYVKIVKILFAIIVQKN